MLTKVTLKVERRFGFYFNPRGIPLWPLMHLVNCFCIIWKYVFCKITRFAFSLQYLSTLLTQFDPKKKKKYVQQTTLRHRFLSLSSTLFFLFFCPSSSFGFFLELVYSFPGAYITQVWRRYSSQNILLLVKPSSHNESSHTRYKKQKKRQKDTNC